MTPVFQKATRRQAKARVAIDGPAGSGKTYTALIAATSLANGGTIAVIDTERGSASLYADEFNFDVLELTTFSPRNYIEAIHAAEKAGYSVIVIDSMSHAWEGEGGILDMHDAATKKQRTENSYTAWKDVTPVHREFVDTMLQSTCHIIATMRAKMEYVQEEVNGKKQIRKIGLAPVQRAGTEYEFTVVCDMDIDHSLAVSKSRCKPMADKIARMPGQDFFNVLRDWLNSGDAPIPQPEKKIEQPKQEEPKAETVRPLSAESLRALMGKKVQKHDVAKATISQADRQIVASVLDHIFNGEKTNRYELCSWLVGVASTKDMSQAQVKALQDWTECKAFDSVPPAYVIAEARSAHAAALVANGQLQMEGVK
jgi:hypothetical protein